MLRCRWCQREFEYSGKGRPSTYCTEACRKSAHVQSTVRWNKDNANAHRLAARSWWERNRSKRAKKEGV